MISDERYIQWHLEMVGGYDKHGTVCSIARPLTGSVSFPVKTFPDTAALEQFIAEFTFFRYKGRCPTWHSVLNKSDCFSHEEKYSYTLNGKEYTQEDGKEYVIQLIDSGVLVVHQTGDWIPLKDRNHHLPWPKSATKEVEFLPPSQTTTLGPHEEPGYVPPVELTTSGGMSTMEDEIVGPNNQPPIKPDFIGTSNGDVAKISGLTPIKLKAVERELRVAEIVGGRSATRSRIRESDGKLIVEDTPIIRDGQVVTGIDVFGKNGELIQVGGPGKNANDVVFGKTKRSLETLKNEARSRGTKAQVYYEQGNSDRFKILIRESQQILGKENVFILPN